MLLYFISHKIHFFRNFGIIIVINMITVTLAPTMSDTVSAKKHFPLEIYHGKEKTANQS